MTAREALFTLICLFLIVSGHIERRDLINRIMAKNFGEYKNEKPHFTPSAHKRILDKWKDSDGGDDK